MIAEEAGAKIAACFIQHKQPCKCYLETLERYFKDRLKEVNDPLYRAFLRDGVITL